MERNFAAVMSELRHARGLSQRKVAADLKEVILVHTVDASLLAEARSLMTRARSRDQG